MQVLLDEEVAVEENDLSPLIEIEEDMTQKEQLASIQKTLDDAGFRPKNWFQRWGFNVLALLVAFGAWMQPQYKQASDSGNDLHINQLIDGQFNAHHFDSLGAEVAELKGQMKALAAFQEIIIGRLIKQDASLSASEFAKNLTTLAVTFDAAKATKIPIDTPSLTAVREKLNVTSANTDGYWHLASSLISYRSAASGNKVNSELPNCWDTYKGHTEGWATFIRCPFAGRSTNGSLCIDFRRRPSIS